MRHGRKVNHLGRTSAHRKALMKNMAIALLISPKKRIFTTVAKAKSLRQYVEPLITRGKDNTTHSRRMAFSYLQNKDAVKELFGQIASKVGDRPGGYTRILKIGARKGDNAEMALIELVDFNEFITEKPKKKSSRRRKKTTTTAAKPGTEATKVDVTKVVAPVAEAPAVVEPAVEVDAPATEEAAGDAE